MTSVDELRVQVNQLMEDLRGIREELRAVVDKLQDGVRLEGEIKRQGDLVNRIGKQVDDHETRLRTVENSGATARERMRANVGSTERLWWLVGLILAGVLGALVRSGVGT